MNWSALSGGMLALGLLLSAILRGGKLSIFVEPHTMLLVVFLTVAFLLQGHGVGGLATLARCVRCWLGNTEYPSEDLENARSVVESGAKATVLGAQVCMLLGAIQISQSLDGDNFHWVGPAFSVMLLSLFYALVLKLTMWGPLGARLARQSRAENASA